MNFIYFGQIFNLVNTWAGRGEVSFNFCVPYLARHYLDLYSLCMQILKGHDDHVITCLEFCGQRIVSGSDDNTLKVWSVVTGKVSRPSQSETSVSV